MIRLIDFALPRLMLLACVPSGGTGPTLPPPDSGGTPPPGGGGQAGLERVQLSKGRLYCPGLQPEVPTLQPPSIIDASWIEPKPATVDVAVSFRSGPRLLTG